jgi:hypothetical protein
MISGPLSRILLRYVAMFFAAKGYFDDSAATQLIEDRDVQQVIEMCIGGVLSVAVETYYKFARKYGWPT